MKLQQGERWRKKRPTEQSKKQDLKDMERSEGEKSWIMYRCILGEEDARDGHENYDVDYDASIQSVHLDSTILH